MFMGKFHFIWLHDKIAHKRSASKKLDYLHLKDFLNYES